MHVACLDPAKTVCSIVPRGYRAASGFDRGDRGFRRLADDDVDGRGELAGSFASEELDEAIFGRAVDNTGEHEVSGGYGGGGIEARGVDPSLERVEVDGSDVAGVPVDRGVRGEWTDEN